MPQNRIIFRVGIGVFACILVGVPLLLQGVEASRNHVGDRRLSALHLPDSDSRSAETSTDGFSGSVDALVAVRERALDGTLAEFRRAHRELADEKGRLAKAQADEKNLSEEILRLSGREVQLDSELPAVTDALAKARNDYATFEAGVPARIQRIELSGAANRDREYADALERIAAERRERNELRARVGAQREDQEEVYHALRASRSAEQVATSKYSATVEREQSAIAQERERLSRYFASLDAERVRIVSEKGVSTERIRRARVELAAAVAAVAAGPSRVRALESELERLAELRVTQSSSLQIARDEQRRQNEERAIARAREIPPSSEPIVARAESHATVSARPRNASWTTTTSPVLRAPTRSESWAPSPVTSGRYYDPSYRPSVGNQYVRSHVRRDGTFVSGHYKTNPDDSFWNNWSSHGNVNPYTGSVGRTLPTVRGSSGGSVYVRGYTRRDGTYVSPHYRRK